MRQKFSDRVRVTQPVMELLNNEIPNSMTNRLWTLVFKAFHYSQNQFHLADKKNQQIEMLWCNYLCHPVDEIENLKSFNAAVLEKIKLIFYQMPWYEKINFIEYVTNMLGQTNFEKDCNKVFEEEHFAYRFLEGIITPITDRQEIDALEEALEEKDRFALVTLHLKDAVAKFSSVLNPDYRNSIKESISAVESLCKIIANDQSKSLGKALEIIEKKHPIPNNLKQAFDKLYAYTNDSGGIRHSLKDGDIEPGEAEAKFMLIACSAFINYLKKLI
ncbi:hypothetical protein MASR1M12_19090 [Erysipelotrichia bacterium]